MHVTSPNRSLRSVMSALAMASVLLAAARVGTSIGAVSKLDVLRLDYAYYNPVSLVLRRMHWVEQDLARDGTRVEWLLSLGSNKANEYTASGAVQFGSTAGSAALLARANGVPLKTVWIYSQPEWTAVVVPTVSAVRDVRDLRGKKVAATRRTHPWVFLPPDPRPGARQQQVLTRLVPLIRAESLVPPDVDLAKAIEDLVAPEPAGRTLGASGSSR